MMFGGFFVYGCDGINKWVSVFSNGRFDYAKNQKGDYRFWYRGKNGEWDRSSLCLFTNYLYNTSRSIMKYEQSDAYLINRLKKEKKDHLGYTFIDGMKILASKI